VDVVGDDISYNLSSRQQDYLMITMVCVAEDECLKSELPR
jgi:hypothetical protein